MPSNSATCTGDSRLKWKCDRRTIGCLHNKRTALADQLLKRDDASSTASRDAVSKKDISNINSTP